MCGEVVSFQPSCSSLLLSFYHGGQRKRKSVKNCGVGIYGMIRRMSMTNVSLSPPKALLFYWMNREETGETLTGTGLFGIIIDCWKPLPAPDRAGQAEDGK